MAPRTERHDRKRHAERLVRTAAIKGEIMIKTEDIIEEITLWIDSNIHKPLRIEDVASRAGYSKWHLQRIFSQVQKISIGKYIREKRLALAEKELVETNAPIIDIVCKYGFDSQQTFTRVFSRNYKLPPSKYRDMKRMQD